MPVNARDGRNAAAVAVWRPVLRSELWRLGSDSRTYYPGPNAYQVYESEPSECRVLDAPTTTAVGPAAARFANDGRP